MRRSVQGFRNDACGISIHAPLAGCDSPNSPADPKLPISIHAPLAGCDLQDADVDAKKIISIHAPLAGCDQGNRKIPHNIRRFQSTHPLRGATSGEAERPPHFFYFNPRTPCGVRPRRAGRSRAPDAISIHAPLAGCDLAGISALRVKTFQSTHPLRGATTGSICFLIYIIRFQSTHPLRGATT